MNYVIRGQEGLPPISNPKHKRILLPVRPPSSFHRTFVQLVVRSFKTTRNDDRGNQGRQFLNLPTMVQNSGLPLGFPKLGVVLGYRKRKWKLLFRV